MADSSKTRVYTAKFDVKSAISSLTNLQRKISDIDKKANTLFKDAVPALEKTSVAVRNALKFPPGSMAGVNEAIQRTTTRALSMRAKIEKAYSRPISPKISTKGSSLVQRMLAEEKSARDRLNASIVTYRSGLKAAAKEAEKAARETAKATNAAAKEAEKLSKSIVRARQSLKKTFLGIGKSSSFGTAGISRMIAGVGALAASYIGLHRAIMAVGKAKDDFLRFDEITTAALTIAKPTDEAYRYGAEGAKQFRESVRDAANEMRTSAGAMADSALFWVKAGQKNLESVTELSKVGVLFARANRDTANNILEQSRANDILSDMVTMFRKDMSTPEKAMESAQTLGEQITAAANSSNIVAEQLFEYSKKVGALFKAGEVRDEEILAISASLASAGLKEESGVHVRRIMTQLANDATQKVLANVGVQVADQEGNIRSFGEIFGELQKVLETQAPLERMTFLKSLFGQRAVSTAAALAGLNKEAKGETSIATILDQIENSKGIMSRNQEEQLKTLSGRISALVDRVTNALGEMFERSSIISDVVGGLESNLPNILEWIEGFGKTLRDVIIPGIQMAYEQISEWLAPAMSVLSSLFGGASTNAEDLAGTISFLVKMWIRWKLALLAIKALRMVDWLIQFTRTIKTAAMSTKLLGTATQASAATATTAVGKLPGVFAMAGAGIAAAIIGWEIGSLINKYVIEPMDLARIQTRNFVSKYGENFEKLDIGKESTKTLQMELKKADVDESDLEFATAFEGISAGYGEAQGDVGENDRKKFSERKRRLEEIINLQQLSEARHRKEQRSDTKMLESAKESESVAKSVSWRRAIGYKEAKEEKRIKPGDTEAGRALIEATDRYRDVVSGAIRDLNDNKIELQNRYDDLTKQLESAGKEDKAEIQKTLGEFRSGINSLANAIDGYTNTLNGIDEKSQARERARDAAQSQKDKYKGAFKGKGKTQELDPYATPLLTSLDREGNRRIHLGIKQGPAATVFQESPQMRELLRRSLEKKPGIQSIHFGDHNITISAKTDAKPEDIAKIVNREVRRAGKQNTREVQRIIGTKMPKQI